MGDEMRSTTLDPEEPAYTDYTAAAPVAGDAVATPPAPNGTGDHVPAGDVYSEPAADGGGKDAGLLEMEDAAKMDVMSPDDEDVASGELGHRKHVPDTPIHLAAFHIFKGNVGVGIFLLPMVYNDAGFVLGPLLAVPIGLIVVDSMLILLRSKVEIGRAKVQSYPEVSDFVFGSLMRVVVNAAIICTQLGFCLLYLQASATIFSEIVDFSGAYKVFVLLELFVVLPLCFYTHNLKLLAISSAMATFLVWFCVVGTMVNFLQTLQEAGGSPAETTTYTGKPQNWPIFIASNLTVLEGIALVLPVENSVMPRHKPKVKPMVKVTMGAIIALYLVYAMVGYASHGCALKNTSVSVLPKNAIGDLLRVGLALNLLLTYPLQFVPAIQIIDRALNIPVERTGGKSKKATLTRVGINVLNMMVAMLVGTDALGLIVGFIGATAAVFLAMILPAMLGLHTSYAVEHSEMPREGKAYFKAMFTLNPNPVFRLRCFMYVVIGVFIFIVGTVTVFVDTASLVNRKTHTGATHSGNATEVTCDL